MKKMKDLTILEQLVECYMFDRNETRAEEIAKCTGVSVRRIEKAIKVVEEHEEQCAKKLAELVFEIMPPTGGVQ